MAAQRDRDRVEIDVGVGDAQPGGPKDPRLGRTWDRILEAYGEIVAGTPADRALKAVFKKARDLGPRERATVSEFVYGLVRKQRTIDDLLDRALRAEKKSRDVLDAPIILRLRALTHLAASGATLEAIVTQDRYAAKRIPGLFERITSGRVPAAKRTPIEEVAIEASLPDWMVSRLADGLGFERAAEIARALAGRAPLTLRVHGDASTRDAVRARILEEHGMEAAPTLRSPLGLILPEHVDISGWPLFEEGVIEVQDEGSQLLALATGASEREVVLDGCAGAGGKTLALAAMMKNTGRVVAIDPDGKKLEELRRRARRAGLTNIEAIQGQLEALPEKLRETFDRVLVDAPCTGSGAFRRHPDARWRTTEKMLLDHAGRQRRLLAGAAGALKPGGLIAYATCSVFREENEDVVDNAREVDTRLEPVPLATTLGPLAEALGATDRLRLGPGPSDRDPDGFFVALLRRRPS